MKSIFERIIIDCRQYKIPLLILMLYLGGTQILFHVSCPSVILFGIPCPACGLTRAGFYLLSGDFSTVFSTNPTIFVWAFLLLYFFVSRYILNCKPKHYLFFATLTGIITIIYFVFTIICGHVISVGYPGIIRQLLLIT